VTAPLADAGEQIADAAKRYRGAAEKRMRGQVDGRGFKIAFGRCESPIEQAFCLALFQVPDIYAIDGDYRPALGSHVPKRRGVLVFAQNPIKRYRADFLLVALSPLKAEPAFLIVECDGQAFHSSDDAIIRDAARERELRATGFRIVRHTGSQIHQSPAKVIDRTMANLASHGWDRAEGDRWVSDPLIRRAMLDMTGGESEKNPMMGHRSTTFKTFGSSLQKAFINTETKWLARSKT
jgi:very-short-patch-repair endonuclease